MVTDPVTIDVVDGRCRAKRGEGTHEKAPDSAWVWRTIGLMRRSNSCRETKFSGENGEREEFIFPIQLNMSTISNHIWLIHTLLKIMLTHT